MRILKLSEILIGIDRLDSLFDNTTSASLELFSSTTYHGTSSEWALSEWLSVWLRVIILLHISARVILIQFVEINLWHVTNKDLHIVLLLHDCLEIDSILLLILLLLNLLQLEQGLLLLLLLEVSVRGSGCGGGRMLDDDVISACLLRRDNDFLFLFIIYVDAQVLLHL